MEMMECVSCGVRYPKPALTKAGECHFCDPPYDVEKVKKVEK